MARNSSRVAAAVSVAALAGGGVGAGAVALAHHSSPERAATSAPTVSNVAAGTTLTVGQIAKQSSPGVVEVDSTTTTSQSPFPGSGSSRSAAEGTGFVYDAKGDIVTNEHVIDGASSISVKFSDGSVYKATVVGSDTSSDLAVLHVDAPASKLTPLELGDSSNVAVGDGVVAIGNPFGLDNSVTSGIVSALNREIAAPDNTPIEGAIQTDAAINHGNSGGPLLNMQGKVIGITSQIESDSGGNDGVGFAVPSATAHAIAQRLISTGKVEHAYLGVSLADASSGARVTEVVPGKAAEKGGIQSGDVITNFAGKKIDSVDTLRFAVDAKHPGDAVKVTVRRNGQTKTVTVTLSTRPNTDSNG